MEKAQSSGAHHITHGRGTGPMHAVFYACVTLFALLCLFPFAL